MNEIETKLKQLQIVFGMAKQKQIELFPLDNNALIELVNLESYVTNILVAIRDEELEKEGKKK